MDFHYLSPYIRVALDSHIDPTWTFKERVLFDYEILYVKAGKIRVTIEDTVYLGLPGDLFFFRPRERHSIQLLDGLPLHQPHIHFDLYYQEDSPDVKINFAPYENLSETEKALFRQDETKLWGIPSHIRLANPMHLEKKIFNIIREYAMKLPYYEASAKGLFIDLWISLMREIHWQHHARLLNNWESLQRVKAYLHTQLQEEVSLETLSQIANLSQSHLIRLFKLAFHMTPIRYHQILRMEKAKEMIQFTNRSISEIADLFGFSDVHSFSRTFRKTEGVPPTYYRGKPAIAPRA